MQALPDDLPHLRSTTEDAAGAPTLRPTGFRSSGACPLCHGRAVAMDRFGFGFKPYLPSTISLAYCAACDFLFVGDIDAAAYRNYYASTCNDGGHVVEVDAPELDVQLQATNICSHLPPDFGGDILDFGCGRGRLLGVLRDRLPDARLHGHDVADWLPEASGIRFVQSPAGEQQRYDVLILSHVLEHLVTFDVLGAVAACLKPHGFCYLEVPDPLAYVDHERREFMYYFDRLHINHFGNRAMERLVGAHGLAVRSTGTHAFRYRDGHYPAAFYIAVQAARLAAAPRVPSADLDRAYGTYRDRERRRAEIRRDAILASAGADGVVAYGAGDNFWRARSPGGPLDGVPIRAVIDRHPADPPAGTGPRFEVASEALARFPTSPVVVTISQGADALTDSLRAGYPERRVFVV